MIYKKAVIESGMLEFVAWLGGYTGPGDLKFLRPYVAVGRGDPGWDAPGADTLTGFETALEDEVVRTEPYLYHALDQIKFDQGKLLYTEFPADVMRFVAHIKGAAVFPDEIDGTYLRELGVFLHAGPDRDSGLLVVLVRHGKLWFDRDFCMRRELIIDAR